MRVSVRMRARVWATFTFYSAGYVRKTDVIDYDLINSCRAPHYILSSAWKTLIRTVETSGGTSPASYVCIVSLVTGTN